MDSAGGDTVEWTDKTQVNKKTQGDRQNTGEEEEEHVKIGCKSTRAVQTVLHSCAHDCLALPMAHDVSHSLPYSTWD